MIKVLVLWILFLLFWNHKAYRDYLKITYNTLYYELAHDKNSFIDKKIATNKGWIP